MEVIHHLLASPVLGVNSRIDDQPDRAPDIRLQSSVVAVRVLVEADILAQSFAVETPAFRIRREVLLLAKLRQSRQLLGDRDLQVMSGNPLVIRDRLHRGQRSLREVVGIHIHPARSLSVLTALVVVRGGLILLDVCRHRKHLELRLRQRAEQPRQLRLHLRDIALVRIQQRVLRRWDAASGSSSSPR